MIPAFRIYFPEDLERIELDDKHLLFNIRQKKYPYGKSFFISDFKRAPDSWNESIKRHFPEADTSIEITYEIKKRLASEKPYDKDLTPFAPFGGTKYNEFDEKVRSIYDFFHCQTPFLEFPPLTFSDKYYILLPPFSQSYPYFSNYLPREFSHPIGFLDLKEERKRNLWLKCWKDNYYDFYSDFFVKTPSSANTEIFRYTLEVLRTVNNIPYTKLRNFLLISTFEALLFIKSVQKKLVKKLEFPKSNKSIPCAKAFVNICEDQDKKWIYFLNKEYNYDLIYITDLEKFLISTYQYRNNIAHPSKLKSPDYKPKYLYELETPDRYEYRLETLIHEWFPKFLKFLVKIWFKLKIKNSLDWYNYIESLFP